MRQSLSPSLCKLCWQKGRGYRIYVLYFVGLDARLGRPRPLSRAGTCIFAFEVLEFQVFCLMRSFFMEWDWPPLHHLHSCHSLEGGICQVALSVACLLCIWNTCPLVPVAECGADSISARSTSTGQSKPCRQWSRKHGRKPWQQSCG